MLGVWKGSGGQVPGEVASASPASFGHHSAIAESKMKTVAMHSWPDEPSLPWFGILLRSVLSLILFYISALSACH